MAGMLESWHDGFIMSRDTAFGEGLKPLYEVKADLFKGLAHPLRIRLLELLCAADEVPVKELIALTGLEPSHVSQHLLVLRRSSLVRSERRGSVVWYRIAHDEVAELLTVARSLLTAVTAGRRDAALSTDRLPGLSKTSP